nr:AP-3 complex subunit beta-1 isoform X2 [Oryctolagus cuniculus]
MQMHAFSPVDSLEPEGSVTVSMGIDFCDSTQTASFQLWFAARTVHSGSLMLVTVELKEGSTAQLIINTEKTVIGSVLLRELKPVLSQG